MVDNPLAPRDPVGRHAKAGTHVTVASSLSRDRLTRSG